MSSANVAGRNGQKVESGRMKNFALVYSQLSLIHSLAASARATLKGICC